MSASEVELGVVEPDPVDPRVDEVVAILTATLDNGDELEPIAVAIVEHLDERAAEAAAELEAEDDGGFDVDLWLLRGGTALYAAMLLAWLVAFGLAVGAVWTAGDTSDALTGTSVLTVMLGLVLGAVGRAVVKAIPDAEVAS